MLSLETWLIHQRGQSPRRLHSVSDGDGGQDGHFHPPPPRAFLAKESRALIIAAAVLFLRPSGEIEIDL